MLFVRCGPRSNPAYVLVAVTPTGCSALAIWPLDAATDVAPAVGEAQRYAATGHSSIVENVLGTPPDTGRLSTGACTAGPH